MNLARKIAQLRPDARFSLSGDSLATLQWHGPGDPPTQAEVDAVILGPSDDMVDAERDRRINQGFEYAGVMFDSREQDQKRIAGAATLALAAQSAGAQPGDLRWHGESVDFVWIAADNTAIPMDAQTTFDFARAAASWESGHVLAARNLKDANPTPADYTDDAYWP